MVIGLKEVIDSGPVVILWVTLENTFMEITFLFLFIYKHIYNEENKKIKRSENYITERTLT